MANLHLLADLARPTTDAPAGSDAQLRAQARLMDAISHRLTGRGFAALAAWCVRPGATADEIIDEALRRCGSAP